VKAVASGKLIGRSLGTTNDSELERRDDGLAFPSEEQRDAGQCSLDSS
jgi:hypothetical protein